MAMWGSSWALLSWCEPTQGRRVQVGTSGWSLLSWRMGLIFLGGLFHFGVEFMCGVGLVVFFLVCFILACFCIPKRAEALNRDKESVTHEPDLILFNNCCQSLVFSLSRRLMFLCSEILFTCVFWKQLALFIQKNSKLAAVEVQLIPWVIRKLYRLLAEGWEVKC